MGSHSVTCHPAEVTFPPLPQPIKAGTRFSDPREMQGWVDLVGLVTYWCGIPTKMDTYHSTEQFQHKITSFMRRTMLPLLSVPTCICYLPASMACAFGDQNLLALSTPASMFGRHVISAPSVCTNLPLSIQFPQSLDVFVSNLNNDLITWC